MQKTDVNEESMDVREVLNFFMGTPHKHSIWLWISWTTVSPLYCPVFSVGSPVWSWFCRVELYLVLDAADGIRDMFWIGCFPENRFILLRPLSTLPTQWSEWIFPSAFLLALLLGWETLKSVVIEISLHLVLPSVFLAPGGQHFSLLLLHFSYHHWHWKMLPPS